MTDRCVLVEGKGSGSRRAPMASSITMETKPWKEPKEVYVRPPVDFNNLETEEVKSINVHTLVENANNIAWHFFANEYGNFLENGIL